MGIFILCLLGIVIIAVQVHKSLKPIRVSDMSTSQLLIMRNILIEKSDPQDEQLLIRVINELEYRNTTKIN